VRIPKIVEVSNIAFRPGVDPRKIAVSILLIEISEGLFPFLLLPELIGIVHGMSGFVAENLQDPFVRWDIPFQSLQLRGSKVKRNADRNLLIPHPHSFQKNRAREEYDDQSSFFSLLKQLPMFL
jgi:hypothetical protein